LSRDVRQAIAACVSHKPSWISSFRHQGDDGPATRLHQEWCSRLSRGWGLRWQRSSRTGYGRRCMRSSGLD